MDYYKLDIKDCLQTLETNKKGLKEEEFKKRLEYYGINELKKEKDFSALKIFLRQFTGFLIFILIIAFLISLLLKEVLDATIILIILMLNAFFGFYQEYKAERSLVLLRQLSSPKAKVIRDNKKIIIDSKELVPGDIILLETGDKISADARIIESTNLSIDESTLTGESTPVIKQTGIIKKDIALAERNNMVYSGTLVSGGNGLAVVTFTGVNTELGKIAKLVQTIREEKTPLQNRLHRLGLWLGSVILFICGLIFFIGYLLGFGLYNIFMTSLTLAVSAVPEGLPAVITICLALGVKRMLNQRALIRRLQAVETLGSATVICSDKTGTLTENEMTVIKLFVNNKEINVSGKGYSTKGDFYIEDKRVDSKNFEILLDIAASCNNASLPGFGDPTELALLVLAEKGKIGKRIRINETPFNSIKKYMITVHKINHDKVSYIKGAPEKVLGMCNYYYLNGKTKELDYNYRKKILDKNSEMAGNALRVLGFAFKKKEKTVFVGLAAMRDPPRKEVKEAIKLCNDAGIKTIMITGDHKLTALAIAREIGIKGKVMEGNKLDEIGNGELRNVVNKVSIFARVSPEHKVRILRALQQNREVVVMTGDGINDAPALKKADVGVAMSIKGTDVARESSDMVLIDDNFSSIVNAVKEGRIIYENIKKFVKFLLSANSGEIMLILVALLMRFPLPLLPLQILWINLITDGFPALALSVDTPSKDIMQKKPRDPKESILKGSLLFIVVAGILSTLATFIIFYWEYSVTGNLAKARTLTLMTMVFFELFLVFSCRSNKSLFKHNLFSNKYLLWAIFGSIILQFVLVYTSLGIAFKLVPLNLVDWIKVFSFGFVGFLFFEVSKMLSDSFRK